MSSSVAKELDPPNNYKFGYFQLAVDFSEHAH